VIIFYFKKLFFLRNALIVIPRIIVGWWFVYTNMSISYLSKYVNLQKEIQKTYFNKKLLDLNSFLKLIMDKTLG
jgi:hypothetical protein